MMGRPWQLPYLGDRNYVHGTTIVEKVLAELQPDFPLDIRFQAPLLGAVDVRSAPREKPNVAVRFERNGQRVLYGLFDAGHGVSSNRASFDEGAIAARLTFSERRVSSSHDCGASLIARIVVMKKTLMARMFPNARGKWWFAELWLEAWPATAEYADVEFSRSIGTRLVRSTIHADGDPLGRISFSLTEAGNP